MSEEIHNHDDIVEEETEQERLQKVINYSRKEMFLAGLYDPDSDFKGQLPKCVEAIIGVVGTASVNQKKHQLLHILERLTKYKPLMPLTGSEDEWDEAGIDRDGFTYFQNKRLKTVFKDHEDQSYDVEGYVFEYPDGLKKWGGDRKDMKKVIFPYFAPLEPEIVKVTEDNKEHKVN